MSGLNRGEASADYWGAAFRGPGLRAGQRIQHELAFVQGRAGIRSCGDHFWRSQRLRMQKSASRSSSATTITRYVPKLQKAVNDARTMGDTLKQLGFSVMVAENQNRQAFSETPAGVRQGGRAGRHRVLLLCRPRLRDRRPEFPAADRRAGGDRRPGRTGARRVGPCRSHHRAAAEQEGAHRDPGVRRLPQQSVRTARAPARSPAAAGLRR